MSFFTAANQTKDIIKPPSPSLKFVNFNSLVSQNKPILNLSSKPQITNPFFKDNSKDDDDILQKEKGKFMVNQNLFCNEAIVNKSLQSY